MLAERFDAFLLDLDGVVCLGDAPLPGAARALEALRRMGKPLRVLTNDPRPHRAELRERLAAMGLPVALDELVTAGRAAAVWLARRFPRGTAVSVVGSDGLARELEHAGLTVTTGTPRAVVVGCDERVGYRDIDRAMRAIRAGALFVATNEDAAFPTPDGPATGTGAIVRAVETASGTRPLVVGKPAGWMFALAREAVPPGARAAMVGDGLDTDIAGAKAAGLGAIWVRPGGPPAGAGVTPGATPDYVIAALEALLEDVPPYRPPTAPPGPDRVEAGVTAVVLDPDGRVLLVLRADNGLWGLPSGHVEPGERLEEAVVREVAEETGLRVQVERLIGVYSDPASQTFTYPSGLIVQFVTSSLLCRPTGGSLAADGREALDARFFPPDVLPAPLLPMHPRWLEDALHGECGVVR